MAITIKSIPVLTGEVAERFEKEAVENAQNPTPKLTPEQKARLEAFLESSRQFQIQLIGE